MKKYKALIFLIPLYLLNSCNNDRLDIDVSGVDLKLVTKRLDKSIFPIDTANLGLKHEQLKKEFGKFADVYLSYILQTGGLKDLSTLPSLATDPVYDLVLTTQGGIDAMEKDIASQIELLESSFKHLLFYFPEAEVPAIVLMNSWFQYGVFTTDSTLAIGLDFFVPDTAIQKVYPPQFYAYMKQDMKPKFIATNAMYGWLFNKVFPTKGEENTLLDHMIYKGKVRYLLEAMFPSLSESVIMNYSEEELEWCYKKQLAVWRELTKIQADKTSFLYEEKKSEISKWISQGPFTSALSEEATDRMGEWIGLQMIRDFMRENPEVSINEMLEINSRKIFKYYNPKR